MIFDFGPFLTLPRCDGEIEIYALHGKAQEMLRVSKTISYETFRKKIYLKFGKTGCLEIGHINKDSSLTVIDSDLALNKAFEEYEYGSSSSASRLTLEITFTPDEIQCFECGKLFEVLASFVKEEVFICYNCQ